MSLNKFTDINIGKDIKLNIGCTTMECETMGCNSHFSEEIDTGKVVINTTDNKKVNLEFSDVGQPGYVLHTDGADPASVYWAPDVGSNFGIVYSGLGTDIGRHLKSASSDGLTANNSAIRETFTELDMGTLKCTNATDPTNPQDLTTKNYVDTQAVSLDLRKQFSTGLLSGGFITINAGDTTKIDISAGSGIIVDPTTGTKTDISWSTFTAIPFTPGSKESFIVIQPPGSPQVLPSKPPPSQERDKIFLGTIYTPDGINVSSIDNQPIVAVNIGNTVVDLTSTLNNLNKNGNIISSNSGLTIQKTNGRIFAIGANFSTTAKNPNFISSSPLDSAVDGLTYYMKNCSSSSILTTVNPNNLDNGTNYPGTPMTPGYWSVQRVYSSCSTENKLHLMLGQFEYPTKDQAINNINSEGFDDTQCAVINRDCLIGLIAVQQGTTDLVNAEFLPLDKYGYSTKIDLTPYLTQATADPLYVNVSGDTMTGTLTMDSTLIPANINLTNSSVIQQDGINAYQSLQRTDASNIITGSTAPSMIGTNNNSYGLDALVSCQGGSNNIAIGTISCQNINSGSDNTAIGYATLGSATTQSRNIAIGNFSMFSNTGQFNLGIGWSTVKSGSGSFNTGIGDGCLSSLTSGEYNTAIGAGSLSSLQSGVGNFGFGANAGSGLTTESNNIMFGLNTDAVGFNNCVLFSEGTQADQSYQFNIGTSEQIIANFDNNCDLGRNDKRFKDLYLSGLINSLGIIGNSFTQTTSLPTYSTQTTYGTLLSSGVGTTIIPANTIVAGTKFKINCFGIYSCTAGDDIQFRLRGGAGGSNTLYETPVLNLVGSASNTLYEIEMDFTIRNTGPTADFAVSFKFIGIDSNGNVVGSLSSNSTPNTINTLVNNIISLEVSLINSGMSINSTQFTLDRSR